MPDAPAYVVYTPDDDFPPMRVCENRTHAEELAKRFMLREGAESWNIYPLVLGEPVEVRRE